MAGHQLQIERRGLEGDSSYPTWIATAQRARWQPQTGWVMEAGTMHVLTGQRPNLTITFDSLRDRYFRETPTQLMASPKTPKGTCPFASIRRHAPPPARCREHSKDFQSRERRSQGDSKVACLQIRSRRPGAR